MRKLPIKGNNKSHNNRDNFFAVFIFLSRQQNAASKLQHLTWPHSGRVQNTGCVVSQLQKHSSTATHKGRRRMHEVGRCTGGSTGRR